MKRKEIVKRAIALTACMVMCVTSMPVSLFAAGTGETAAGEAEEVPGSGSKAAASDEEADSEAAAEENGDNKDGGSGAEDTEGSSEGSAGTGDVGTEGEGSTNEGTTEGNGSESGGTDVTEPGGSADGSGGTEGAGSGGIEDGDKSGETEPDTPLGSEGELPDKEGDGEFSETTRPAIDWTNNMDILGVSLNQISWEAADGAGSCSRTDQGQWDLSALYEEAAENVTLNYTVSMKNDSIKPLLAGDSFSIALPSGLFAIQADSGNLNPDNEKPEAGYITSGSSVQVTLTDAVEQEGFGGFQASLTVKAAPLAYEPGETVRVDKVIMQSQTDAEGNLERENKAEFFLPAKAEKEPDGENPGDGSTEENPDGENPGDGSIEEKPDGENPGDGSTEEKPDGENPGDGSTEEKPEGEAPNDETTDREPQDLSGMIPVILAETEVEVGEDYTVELPIIYTIPEATEIVPNDSFALSVGGITITDAQVTAATAVEEVSNAAVRMADSGDISEENGPAAPENNAPEIPNNNNPAVPESGEGTPDNNSPAEPENNDPAAPENNVPSVPENDPAAPDNNAPETPENGEGTPDNNVPSVPESGAEAPGEGGNTESMSPPEKTAVSAEVSTVSETQVTTVFTESAKAAAALSGMIQLFGTVTKEDVEKGKATFSIQGQEQEVALLAPKADDGATQVSFKKEWIGASPTNRPDLLATDMAEVYYSLDGGVAIKWKPGDLDITDWTKDGTGIGSYTVDDSQGVGYETYTLTVPQTWQDQNVTYCFVENADAVRAQGYVPADVGPINPGEKFQNIEQTTFEAVLDIRDGDKGNKLDFFKTKEALTLYQVVDGVVTEIALLNDLPSGVTAEMKDPSVQDGTLVISGLPRYTADQIEISYYIKAAEKTSLGDGTTDRYLPTYDNSASSNFGSITDACHDKGTLTLLLVGETEYVGHKMWIDDNERETIASRPKGNLYLWRYSGKDADYKTASQVDDPEKPTENKIWELDTKNQTSEYNTKDDMSDLPKYDPDGYPYTYFIKETVDSGEYEQVMGAITEDADGKVTVTDTYGGPEKDRPKGDMCLYNGGTISNRRTGSISMPVTKTWNAASFQSQLEDVSVMLALEGRCKAKNGEEAADWKQIGDLKELKGFYAEQLTQTTALSGQKYDEMGREMEYRVVEKCLKQGGIEIPIVEDPVTYKRTFTLEQGEGDQKEEVAYESLYDKESGLITNTLIGTTDYTVEKFWKQDGTSDPWKVPPTPGAEIHINLYQDDVLYATYTMDGTLEPAPSSLTLKGNPVAGTGQEVTPYIVKFEKLPKYNDSGRRHTYIAEEETYIGEDGKPWHAEYKYDAEKRRVEITNVPTGEGKSIRVAKKWLDDSDVEHRVPIMVDVYEKQGADPDPANDRSIAKGVVLNAANNWWKDVGITEDVDENGTVEDGEKVETKNCYIKEVSSEGVARPDDVKGTDKVYVDETAQIAYTNYHMYQISGGTTADLDGRKMLYITNRRIGIVNLDVTKKWIDGENIQKNRPAGLTLKLHCEEYNDVINYKDNTVNLGNDSLPILMKDGKGGVAEQKVDAVNGISEYSFYNLPKYDAEGKVVHYSITEEDQAGALTPAEYTSSMALVKYTVGDAQHTNDSQEIAVTNRKSANKPVKFYKLWKDQYAFETGKRPDIYLDLYQASGPNGETITPMDYREHLWTRASEPNDSDWKWICDFGQMDKYDGAGYEITYYARERTHVDPTALGYDTSDVAVMDTKNLYTKDYLTKEGAAEQNVAKKISDSDTRLLLKEGCTFVNKLKGEVIIDGKKVWKNVPDGLPFEDFPGLTIRANRTTTKPPASPAPTFVDVKKLVKTMKPNAKSLLVAAQGEEKDPNLVENIANTTLTTDNRVSEGSNNFTFKMQFIGANDFKGDSLTGNDKATKLPKYDENGALYYYSVVEEVIGGVGNLGDTTYENLPGEVNNFIITNTYNAEGTENTGKLTVSKTWDGIATAQLGTEAGQYQYPAADFKLYRQYVSKDTSLNTSNGMTKPEPVGEPKRLKYGVDTSGTVIFENLRVMAPNGTKYYYYVEETLLNGYDTIANGSDYKSNVVTLEETVKDEKDEKTFQGEVNFKNAYEPQKSKVVLTGTKTWADHSNAFGTRPTLDEFKKMYSVYRYADKQSGADGAPAIKDKDITSELQGDNSPDDFYLQWTGENTDTWTYTISNLERYAPNSMPWKYKIVEEEVPGYDKSAQTINSGNNVPDENNKIHMPAWTNNGLTTAAIEKIWADDNYGLRPKTIQAELYAKKGNGDWEKASTLFGNDLKILGGDLPENLKDLTCTIKADGNGNWNHTFTDLPAYVKDATDIVSYTYQVVETQIGNYTVNVTNILTNGKAVYPETGPYKIDAEVDGTTTEITNSYGKDNKYLSITKKWDNDTSNGYGTRPADNNDKWYADFALYQKPKDGNWVQYKNTDNNYIILRVTGDKTSNTAVMKFGPFPKFATYAGGAGKEYSYAAVEITPTIKNETPPTSNYKKAEIITVDGAKVESGTITGATTTIKTDPTDTVVGNAIPVDDTTVYDTTVETTNTLLTTDLKVAKNWDDDSTAAFRPEEIELELQRTTTDQPEPITEATTWETVPYKGDKNAIWSKDDTNNKWTATFSSLPAYDTDGTPYLYQAVEKQVSNYQPPEFTETTEDTALDTPQTMEITNKISEFEISKVLTGGRDDEILPVGAKLQILNASGTRVATWECVKDNDGAKVTTKVYKDDDQDTSIWTDERTMQAAPAKGTIKGLKAGTYTLREVTAPAGYETAADIKFELKSDGTIESETTSAVSSGKYDQNTVSCITMTDEKVKVDVKKVDIDGTELTDEALKNLVFTVSGVFADQTVTQTLSPDKANAAGYLISKETDNPENLYTLTEVTAPDGYIKGQPITFWVDKDGKVTIKDSHNLADNKPDASAAGAAISYRNAPIEISLEKHDTDSKVTKALEGAVFTLTDNGKDGMETIPLPDVTTEAGSLVLKGLIQNHQYTLVETTAPKGYILTPEETARTYTFKVTDAGKVDVEGLSNPDDFWKLDDNTTSIKLFNAPIVIELEKTDATDSRPIAGVKFTLKNTTVQMASTTVETGADGRLILSGPEHDLIQENTYTLTETPAEGYDLPENILTITFTVNTDGTIADLKANYIDENKAEQGVTTDRVSGNLEGKVPTIHVKNIRQKGSVEILKVDAEDTSKVLEGAVFQLQKEVVQADSQKENAEKKYENIPEGTADTDANGVAKFTELDWGSYRIIEIKPPVGYVLNSETVFDFTISAASRTASFTDASKNEAFKNDKTNVKILKKAEGSEDPLGGASFKIYDLGKSPDTEPEKGRLIYPIDDNPENLPGTIQLSGILSVNTYYAIVEESAPDGYEKLAQYVVMSLNEDGTCGFFDNYRENRWTINPQITNLLAMEKSIAPVTITAADTPLNVDLYKVAEGSDQADKTFLEGAELTVSGTFKDTTESSIKINKDNFNTAPLKGMLLAGEGYTIEETTAPTGYTRFTGKIAFTLDEYGKISRCDLTKADETAATSYAEANYDKDKAAIWIHDAPLKIEVKPQIRKIDDAGKMVPGISFTLTGKLGDNPSAKETLTSDEDGNLLTDDLLMRMHVGETYTLKEQYQEPSAYEELTEEIKFRMDDGGAITLVTDNSRAANAGENVLTITNVRTEFTVSKTDEKNRLLAGANLTIYTNEKTETGTDQPKDIAKDLAGNDLKWQTKAEAPETITGLTTGTYWLVETLTPEGYQSAKPVKFILNKEGKVSSADSWANIDGSGLCISMKDPDVRGHVILTKTEETNDGTGTGINGAEFTLYKLTPGETSPNPEKDTWIADKLTTADAAAGQKSGIWSSKDSDITNSETEEPLSKGLRTGAYYFVETKAPDRYQLDSTPCGTFEIKGNVKKTELSGSVTVDVVTAPEAEAEAEVTNSLISALEHQRFLTVYKEDAQNREALADAVFTLERIKDMDGNKLETPEPVTVNGETEVKTAIADGKASVTFGPLTDKGIYRLTETMAADGYDLNRTVTEYDAVVTDHKAEDLESWEGTVKDNKILLHLLEKDTEKPIADNIVKNERLTGSVNLKKVDEDGVGGLNGVAFKLSYKAGDAADFQEINYSFQTGNSYSLKAGNTWDEETAEADILTESMEDAQKGGLRISNLAWGTYRLQETQQLPGYINKAETFEFEIGSKEKADSDNQGTGIHHILDVTTGYGTGEGGKPDGKPAWEEAADGHTLCIVNEKTRVSFVKRMKGETEGLPGMAGAEFTLTGKFADGQEEKTFVTSDEEPAIFIGLLIGGEQYTLTETKAPDGALPANNFTVTFTMNINGRLTTLGEITLTPEPDTPGPAAEETEGTDPEPPAKPDSNPTAELTPARGSEPAEITVSDTPVTMKVFKKGADTAQGEGGGALLEGCTFEVTGKFAPDRGIYKSGNQQVQKSFAGAAADNSENPGNMETILVTTTGTDNKDVYNALSGRLIIGKTYKIKEITPPDGYAVGMDVSFSIQKKTEESGEVTTEIVLEELDNNYDITQDEDGNPVITQRDNPVGLKLHKVGSNRPDGLNGAKFTLTGVKLADREKPEALDSLELTSEKEEDLTENQDGWIDLTGLVNETNVIDGRTATEYRYTLKETQAPAGYSRVEDITFRIESGKQEGSDIPVSRFVLLDQEGNPVQPENDGKYPAPYSHLFKEARTMEINGKKVSIDVVSVTDQYHPPVYLDNHTVEKVWEDKDDEAQKRPDSITVKLFDENNQEVSYAGEAVLNEGNGWKYTWTGLSQSHSYHAVEMTDLSDTGYTAVMDTKGRTTVITNTYEAAEPSPTPEVTPTVKPEQSITPTPTHNPVKPTETPRPTKTPAKPTGTPGAAATPYPTATPGSSGGSGNGGNGGNNPTDKNYGTDSSSTTTQKTPTKTGDETNTMIYLFLLLMSGVVIMGYIRKIHRNEENK